MGTEPEGYCPVEKQCIFQHRFSESHNLEDDSFINRTLYYIKVARFQSFCRMTYIHIYI